MTKPTSIDQRTTAATRRQAILDFLNANPGAQMGPIGNALFGEGKSRSRHHNTVRVMIEWGEVRFEGDARARRYWATKKTTRTADEVQQACENGIRSKNADRIHEATTRVTNTSLGIYVHIPGEDKHGRPGEGGQGCLRRATYINCEQSY
ncbi:MAG: hypothetical protein M0Q15_15730 [Nevskia sp.]|jgi:hypothetical protein|nr:hypothetical protein [Nevskia sp.]